MHQDKLQKPQDSFGGLKSVARPSSESPRVAQDFPTEGPRATQDDPQGSQERLKHEAVQGILFPFARLIPLVTLAFTNALPQLDFRDVVRVRNDIWGWMG